MKLYEKFSIIENSLIFPFIFGGVFIALSEILQLIGTNVGDNYELVLLNFSELLYKLLPYVFCYYFSVSLNDGKRWFVGSWSVLCLAVFSTSFNTVSNAQISFFAGLAVALLVHFTHKYFKNKVAFLSITLIITLLTGLALGYLFEYYNNFNMFLSRFVSGKGLLSSGLFAVLNSLYSLLGCSNFSEMFFYKSYGGSMLINEEIVTGVKDLLLNGYDGKLLSTYLSGHYYLLFALTGICISMLANLKGVHKVVLITLLASTAVSGNFSLLFLFVFLECPFLFISTVIISALAYVSAYVINLGSGYIYQGGIIEMIMYHGNVVYLLAGGTVFLAIGYFVYKYCYEKYGISDCYNIYFPTRLNHIVDALGGVGNIIRFREGSVEVRNPKLVNNLSLSNCEIDENIIKSDDEELEQLKEYFDENKR